MTFIVTYSDILAAYVISLAMVGLTAWLSQRSTGKASQWLRYSHAKSHLTAKKRRGGRGGEPGNPEEGRLKLTY